MVIMTCIHTHTHTGGAFCALAQDNKGKSDILEHSVETLTTLVKSKDAEVKSNAKQAILLTSCLEPAKVAFVSGLVAIDRPLLLHVFGASASPQLNTLLTDPDPYVRMHGTSQICYIHYNVCVVML